MEKKAVPAFLKDPAFLAAVAAPLVVYGIGSAERATDRMRNAKLKTEAYRSMLELHPKLRRHDPKEVSRVYNSLHTLNPDMAHDPLIAGAYVDNIFDTRASGYDSYQSLPGIAKDLVQMRSQASRGEHRMSLAPTAEAIVHGVGKNYNNALKDQIQTQLDAANGQLDRRAAQRTEAVGKLRSQVAELRKQRNEVRGVSETQAKAQHQARSLEGGARKVASDESIFQILGL